MLRQIRFHYPQAKESEVVNGHDRLASVVVIRYLQFIPVVTYYGSWVTLRRTLAPWSPEGCCPCLAYRPRPALQATAPTCQYLPLGLSLTA